MRNIVSNTAPIEDPDNLAISIKVINESKILAFIFPSKSELDIFINCLRDICDNILIDVSLNTRANYFIII
jgi:hypothetical protein